MELQHEKMLSSFPFNFNLRRYNMGVSSRDNMPRDDHAANAWFLMAAARGHAESVCEIGVSYVEAGAYTRPLLGST